MLRVPLAPDRPVGEVTRELLAGIGEIVGPVEIDPTPQEVPWTVPLDETTSTRPTTPGGRRRLVAGRPAGTRISRPAPRAIRRRSPEPRAGKLGQSP
jgi:hypothetical protein